MIQGSDADGWEFGFVLHNLELPLDVADEGAGEWPHAIADPLGIMVIARNNDPRVVAVRSSSRAVDQILSSFQDETRKPCYPAVLLVRRDAPDKIRRNTGAYVDFRNAVAMALVLRARAANARGQSSPFPTWSDAWSSY